MGAQLKCFRCSLSTAITALLAIAAVLLPEVAFAADLNSVGITPPPDSDLSTQIIGSLTGLVESSGTISTIAPATNVLGNLMSTWNASMMFVGSIIVGYIIIAGVLQTAHQGEALGRKWNSNMVPARATLGLAMTAPVAAGFSAIQVIVVWVALQGIGLADMMWSKTVDVISKNGGFVTTPDVSDDAAKLVGQLYVNMACMASVNREIANANAIIPTYAQGAGIMPYQYGGQLSSKINLKTIGTDYGITFENRVPDANGNLVFGDGFCGKFSWNQADVYVANEFANGATGYIMQSYHDMGGQLIESQRAALMSAYQQLYPIVEKRFGSGATQSSVAGPAPTAAQLLPAARAYMKTVTDATANMQSFMDKQGMQSFGENAAKDGWVMAGSYYSRIGHMNQAANDLISAVPSSIGSAFEDESSYQGDLYRDIRINIAQAKADIENISEQLIPGSVKETETLRGSGLGIIAHPFLAFQDKINQMMYAAGDPMSRTQNIGHVMLDSWYAIKAIELAVDLAPQKKIADAAGSVVGGSSGGGLMSTAMGGITGVINTITPMLLIGGITLAYVFPMIPFSIMLFGVMSWLVSFFIALVAAPLWAISHATPDGHDAFGSGVNGYILLMSVALRPALTILAMIGSMGIMYGMDKLLAFGFTTAFAGAQVNSVAGPIGFVSGVAIFAILSCVLAYGSFRMVQTIPNAILEWIGGKDDDSLGVENHHGHFTAVAARFGSGMPGAAAAIGAGAKSRGGNTSDGGDSGAAKLQKDLSIGSSAGRKSNSKI